MNSFFGIVTLKKADGLLPHHNRHSETCRQKFLSQYGKMQHIQTAELMLNGDFETSKKAGQTELYFCGELYNAFELAAYIKQPEAAQWPSADLVHQLLLSHGLSSAKKINGRFFICYVDRHKNAVHLINDQMGVQQVYYHSNKDFLLFGSEIKFLLAHPLCPRKIDWVNAMKRPLPFIVLDGERSYNAWFEDIHLMAAATDMSADIRTGELRQQTYWDPYRQATNESYRSAEEVMEAYMSLLDDAVRIRVSDNQTAHSFLSGGLDSSILCALAHQYKPLDTYGIITHTTLIDGATEAGARLATDLGFNNTQFLLPYNSVAFDAELWKKRIWKAESPFTHPDSLAKTLLHYAIGKYEKPAPYVLTGTGSDQLNGGLARWIAPDLDTPEESWSGLSKKLWEEELRHYLPQQYDTLWGSRHYLTTDFIQTISDRQPEKNSWLFYLKSNLHVNFFTLLWDENRAASAHHRSVRFPFLDFRFLEFLAGIPVELHTRLFFDKQILRLPAAKYLPDYIIDKPKMPAMTGQHDKRTQLYAYLVNQQQNRLLREALGELEAKHPIIDKKAMLREIQKLEQHPDPVAWQYLMHIVNLGLLEHLPAQDEQSMHYESQFDEYLERIPSVNPTTIAYCQKKQGLLTDAEQMYHAPTFAQGCSLLYDVINQRYFLVKDEMLVYEIDETEPNWKQFLMAIDGKRSINDILQTFQFEWEEICDYFSLCIKENILTLQPVTNEVEN